MNRSFFLGLSLFGFLIYSASLAKGNAPVYPSVPGELVVRLRAEAVAGDSAKSLAEIKKNIFNQVAQDLQKNLGLKSLVKIRKFQTSDDFSVFQLSDSDKNLALNSLVQDARVAYAEPNYLFHVLGYQDGPIKNTKDLLPTDDQFAKLWGMSNTGQTDASGQVGTVGADIHVSKVWDSGVTGRKEIKVAIIDTGMDYTHPELKANAWINTAEIAGNGVDDDHNGFIDDVNGWNFNTNKSDPNDDHNHGTHCAGVIGAVGNNGVGVAGVNWKVTLVPVKFLDSQGSGTLDAAAQAIQYATSLGVNVMSNSWGGGPFTQTLFDSINEAKQKGILFVAAAGNDSSDNDSAPSYPASYQIDNILAVAATDNQDHLAAFSNFGKTTVQVSAPGVQILSTFKGGTYGVMSGTSMATPHVAGIAALLLSNNPSLTYAQLKDLIIRSSDKIKTLSRKVVSKGRVNVYNAIHGIFPADIDPPESLWQDVAYTAETPHPYANAQTYTYAFSVPKAKYVRVVFDSIDTEPTYDKISIRDAKNAEADNISGSFLTGYTSDYIEGTSGQIVFTSDASVNKTGFKVGKLQAIY